MIRTALILELPGAEADRLSDRLIELGLESVMLEDAAAGTAEEQPLFDEPDEQRQPWPQLRLRIHADDGEGALQALKQACGELGMTVPPVRIEAVPEQDWVLASQSQFDPVRISERLWVVPSWHEPQAGNVINLRLDPGLAFGTGSHPTTRLCMRWLEREVKGGETLLDYGCGSGILAIAAMKLGAARALGVDIDPIAVRSAQENARLNAVHCEFRDASSPLVLEADLVVANILANPLKVLAPALARLTRLGGKLALAGLLSAQAGEVAECYRPWFDLEDSGEEDGWTRLSFVRRHAA